MNLKEKFKEWNKKWKDMSIEELEKQHSKKHKAVYLLLIIPLFFIIVALVLVFTQELINIIGGLIFIFFAEFQFLKILDASNDLNRINMWIYLKKKLGE